MSWHQTWAGKGAVLRREGLYSSLISAWRDQRDGEVEGGELAGAQRRGVAEQDDRAVPGTDRGGRGTSSTIRGSPRGSKS